MKIVDDREKKSVKEKWSIRDVIEFGDEPSDLSLGMIIQDDSDKYCFVDLQTGSTGSTCVYCDYDLDSVVRDIKDSYKIAHKVNAELHVKEG